ncbi:MAG: hypothetical protein EBS06_05770 [Proteobacteria bacterium]|nr:hypothetical protein [Pseudomonadota bacterium]
MNIFIKKILKNIFLTIFCAVFFFTYFVSSQDSYASDCDDETSCGIGRIRSCSANGDPEGLIFNPIEGGDVMFDMSNPVCLAIATTVYASVKTAIAAMCYNCKLSKYPSVTPSPIRDAALITAGGVKAANTGAPCSGAVVDAVASMSIALAEFGITYGVAKGVFNNTMICGSEWLSPDPLKYSISKPAVKSEVEEWVKNNPSDANLANTNYREWYYGGVEYKDNPSDGDYCEDPTGSNVKSSNGHYPRQLYYLRGSQAGNFNCSKYDITLANNSDVSGKEADYKKAFACCKKRSQNFICIKYKTSGSNIVKNTGVNQLDVIDPLSDNDGVFCESGSRCIIKGITFSAGPIEANDSRLICAQSYSLCPYNFTIGGGTKYCDYFQDGVKNANGTYTYITPDDIAKATDPYHPTSDCNTKSEIRNADCTYNTKAGQCKNYCQYLTHCTVVGASDYQYQSDLGSPYFSSACYNFVGDSRNLTAFNSGVIIGSQRHFSTPIAQCVKETLENVFYNRAGHSQCYSADEYPTSDGTCKSGKYIQSGSFTYKKGSQVKDVSFFSGLQNALQTTIKMVLSLAIMFYGLRILIGNNMSAIKKSDIMMFVIKIGLVMYFATGDAWQTTFFEGVYNSSMVLSKIVFHIESSMPDAKKDGCQFDSASLGAANQYPANKDYLSIWDTLDCKTARYLGFGPEASAANIASLLFASSFVGPYGIYFVIGLMFFGFFFLAATIRALHIFLSSAIAIILMVYISPIIIPTILFPKTANIFKGWLTNLISFCLQPMILFAYIAIFITVFDSTMIGSASFTGNPPNKTISCKEVCKDDSGNIVNGDTTCTAYGHSWEGGACKNASGNVVYDITLSAACVAKGYSMSGDSCIDSRGNIKAFSAGDMCIALGYNLEGATCVDTSGNDVGGDVDCSKPGHSLVNPLTDSVACLVNFESYSKVNFLETIGISLPSIAGLFTDHVKEKILTIIKAAFVMYVLCQFLDQIPDITSQLIGGAALPGGQNSVKGMMGAVNSLAQGARERITRGGMKFGRDSRETTKDVFEESGDLGSEAKADSPSKDEGGNASGSSSSGEGESQ